MSTSTPVTISDLLANIRTLPQAGVVAPATAEGWLTAIRALQRTLELPDDTDLASVDVDELLQQFRRVSPQRWSGLTVATYCHNIRRALHRLVHHDEQPTQPPLTRARHRAGLTCSLELRPGRIVRLQFPDDLTAAEAQRVAAYLTALPALTFPDSPARIEASTQPPTRPATPDDHRPAQ